MSEEQAVPVSSRNERHEPFRIRVSLQRYFSDERARCYLMVSAENNVRWLEARLQQEFGLSGSLRLVSAGYLLPQSETLALLRPDDPVDVIPIPASEEEQKSRDLSKRSSVAPVPPSRTSSDLASLLTPSDEVLLLRHNRSATDTNGDAISEDAIGDDPEYNDGDDDALLQSKRRALSLLQRLEAGEPPRRRRRVHARRRRRAPPHPGPDMTPDPAPDLTPDPAPDLGSDSVSPPRPLLGPGDVVRGKAGRGATRSPRRVVPLQEAPFIYET